MKQGRQGRRGSKPSRGCSNPEDGRWRAGNARVNRTSSAGCVIGAESPEKALPLRNVELASSVQDPEGRRNSTRGAFADIKPIRTRRPEGTTAWPALPGTAKRDRATHRRDTDRSHRTLNETASSRGDDRRPAMAVDPADDCETFKAPSVWRPPFLKGGFRAAPTSSPDTVRRPTRVLGTRL
jgi:hypothetical protein